MSIENERRYFKVLAGSPVLAAISEAETVKKTFTAAVDALRKEYPATEVWTARHVQGRAGSARLGGVMATCTYVNPKETRAYLAQCCKHVAEGKLFCWQHDPNRPNPQTELKRKAAAYDRLVARIAEDQPLHPELRKFVPFIHAVLDGRE